MSEDIIGRLARLWSPGIRVINSERLGWVTLPWGQRLISRLTVGLASHLIANSRSGAEYAMQCRGFPPAKVSYVPNGIDEA